DWAERDTIDGGRIKAKQLAPADARPQLPFQRLTILRHGKHSALIQEMHQQDEIVAGTVVMSAEQTWRTHAIPQPDAAMLITIGEQLALGIKSHRPETAL